MFNYRVLLTLRNCPILSVFFQLQLTTFGFGINMFTSLCGVQQLPLMLNPIFESSSPSDFWGRRWNLVGEILSSDIELSKVYTL